MIVMTGNDGVTNNCDKRITKNISNNELVLTSVSVLF